MQAVWRVHAVGRCTHAQVLSPLPLLLWRHPLINRHTLLPSTQPPPTPCSYLHSCAPPIIHRDLKSANLLVDKHWRVRVCDFNLSRVMEDQAVLSSVAATNPRWLAPEILSGKGYTFSSDVYAFG